MIYTAEMVEFESGQMLPSDYVRMSLSFSGPELHGELVVCSSFISFATLCWVSANGIGKDEAIIILYFSVLLALDQRVRI